jgi:hypothetical protein
MSTPFDAARRAREAEAQEIAQRAAGVSGDHVSAAPQWCGFWCRNEEGTCRVVAAADAVVVALGAAHQAGRAEGMEDAAKVAEAYMDLVHPNCRDSLVATIRRASEEGT